MKRLFISLLIIIFWAVAAAPVQAEICTLPPGTVALRVLPNGSMFPNTLTKGLPSVNVMDAISAAMSSSLREVYGVGWSNATLVGFEYDCPIHGRELVLIVVKTADLKACK